jgi:hypothetical protein
VTCGESWKDVHGPAFIHLNTPLPRLDALDVAAAKRAPQDTRDRHSRCHMKRNAAVELSDLYMQDNNSADGHPATASVRQMWECCVWYQ